MLTSDENRSFHRISQAIFLAIAVASVRPHAAPTLDTELDRVLDRTPSAVQITDMQRESALTAFNAVLNKHRDEPRDVMTYYSAFSAAITIGDLRFARALEQDSTEMSPVAQSLALVGALRGTTNLANDLYFTNAPPETVKRVESQARDQLDTLLRDYISPQVVDSFEAFESAFEKGPEVYVFEALTARGFNPKAISTEATYRMTGNQGEVAKGSTLLHVAALYGDENTAKFLLQRGVDPTIINNDGKTAADVAREYNMPDLAVTLDAAAKASAMDRTPTSRNPFANTLQLLQKYPHKPTMG